MTIEPAAFTPAVFTPGVGGDEPLARYWLRQVTLRLRREVCWLWRERRAQGVAPPAEGPAPVLELPPFVDPALAALDLTRYEQTRQVFFAEDITARHLTGLIAEDPPESGGAARGSFGWVVDELRLEPVDAFVLALALLPAVDSAAGPVIAACLNEPGRGEPSLALAQRLWREPALLGCFDPGHPLFTHGLLAQAPQGWTAPLTMAPLVARELLYPWAAGRNGPPDGGPQTLLPADGRGARRAGVARRRWIPVLGVQGAALEQAAARAAAADRLPLLPAGAAVSGDHLRALMTVAWLRGAAIYLPPGWLTSGDPHAPAPIPLPSLPVSVYVGLHDRAALRRLGDELLPAIEVPASTHAERLAAWQRAAPSAQPAMLMELARRFRCETAAVERIGAELSRLNRAPTEAELLAATRADLDLGALAQPVAPRFTLRELMLPAVQTRQVGEVVTAMRNLGRVHYQWGTARAWNEGGLAALFAGPPGTGKTMATEAIASELQLPLYRIDLSQVVNKYIGETEKNLKRLFDAADVAEVILFFDEADALFGKRTEVKDAHDRYANLEISYLLERMERFKGLAILATNRRSDLDEAFLRRLRFVIEFPVPTVAERLRIWRSVMPEGVDTSGLDLDFLARRFALAGGHIRSIVFHACLQTALDDAPRRLTMQAVVQAVQRELDKLERSSSLEQFGQYAPLLAPERTAI